MSRIDEILSSLSLTLPLALGKAQSKMLTTRLADTQSCLDIGCGRGRFKVLKQLYAVGCDIHHPTLLKAKAKERNYYYGGLVRCDVRQLPFKPKSFDTVIAMEVIEHLEKTDGIKLLEQMEKIAIKQVVVTTPWGDFPIRGCGGNLYQFHLSGWLPQEFQELGYTTYPFYYSRFPKNSSVQNIIIRYILTLLLYPMIHSRPKKFAQDFVAIKETI